VNAVTAEVIPILHCGVRTARCGGRRCGQPTVFGQILMGVSCLSRSACAASSSCRNCRTQLRVIRPLALPAATAAAPGA
jgi:hypothetical protein